MHLLPSITFCTILIVYISEEDSISRTCIYTASTGTTIIPGERIIILQFKISDQCGDKKEGATLFGDQVSVFSHPANAAALGPASFQYWC